MGAEQEAAVVQVHTSLGGIPVQRAMLTEFRTLNPDDPLQTAIDHSLGGWQQDFPVVFGEHVLGVLTREDVLRTIAQQGSDVRVREAMNREFTTVDSHDMLESALVVLHDCKCRSLPVVHDGRLVGMLTTDNVGEFLMIQSALRRARRGGTPR
jgi:predicted transcriptional regulator